MLDGLVRMAAAIAATFGGSCETLIHDMSKPGHPVVAIFNSQVSGRQVGSTASIFGDDLGTDNTVFEDLNGEDAVNTLAITNSGRYIKSTSVKFEGRDYHYVLGINYDYTPIMAAANTLMDLTTTSANLDDHLNLNKQTVLDDVFEECVRIMGKPLTKMKKPDKVQLIALLMEKKAFDFQKSVTYVADRLGLSRFTVYKYIHEVEENLRIEILLILYAYYFLICCRAF